MSVVLSEGYAPVEQYQRNGHQGTWTDVYGASATLYAMLTGKAPPTATDRVSFNVLLPGLHSVTEQRRRAIEDGMALAYSKRLLDIASLQNAIAPRSTVSTSTRTPDRENDIRDQSSSRLPSGDVLKHLYRLLDSSYLVPLIVALGILLVAKIWINSR